MKENYWSFMKDDLLSVQSIEDNQNTTIQIMKESDIVDMKQNVTYLGQEWCKLSLIIFVAIKVQVIYMLIALASKLSAIFSENTLMGFILQLLNVLGCLSLVFLACNLF